MENSPSTTFSNLNTEFLIDAIMSRFDGPTLAACACASSDLFAASSNQNLWKNLCSTTWPSTKTLLNKGFDKFYAEAFPLILCHQRQNITPNPTVANASCTDLVSLIDIYYKGKCILSKVVNAIPEPIINGIDNHDKDGDELLRWLLDCPFRFDVLPYSDEVNTNIDGNESSDSNDDCITYLPSLASSGEEGKRGPDKRDEVEQDIRLSWIMFNKKSGKAVNLSSWKPIFVKKSWAPDGEYVLHFVSIINMDTNEIPHKFAECKIEARFQLIQNSGYVKWTEISMRVEDMAGAHLGLTKSLGVFNRALYSKRTTKHPDFTRANNEYKMLKKEMRRRHGRREYLVDKLYALVGLTILTTISYGCTTLFH